MRVLLVTKPLVPPWHDGGKIVPRDLVISSADRHELHVLVSDADRMSWPSWVRPHAIYRDKGNYLPSVGQHLRLLVNIWQLRNQVDIFHFFFQPHPMASRTARLLARITGRPTLHTILSAPRTDRDPSRLLFADLSVTLTNATAGLFSTADQTRIVVIPLGLATSDRVSETRKQATLTETDLKPPFVLYPGDFEFSGGHDFLIEVWKKHTSLPPLVFSGREKTPKAASVRSALQSEVTRQGLTDRITFLGTLTDLPALISLSAAVLFPAKSLYGKTDPPVVLLEAWREHVPVLSSDIPPLQESMNGGGVVLPFDVDSWASAIQRLPNEGTSWGEAGYNRFQSDFTAESSARRYADLYDRLDPAR